MREKLKCYELNCSNVPLKRVGVNMLKILGIQPGSSSFEKQKDLIAVRFCEKHFLTRFPSYLAFKLAFFQGILLISKSQYIKLSKHFYNVSLEKRCW